MQQAMQLIEAAFEPTTSILPIVDMFGELIKALLNYILAN